MRRYGKIVLAATLFAVLFVWATRGHFWTPFTAFFPRFHLLYAASVLGLLLFFGRPATARAVLERIVAWRYLLFPATAFLMPLVLGLFFFHETQQPIDSSHYLWTAKLFLSGRLYLPLPPFYEHAYEGFMVVHGDRYYTLFPPGYPVLLMPFAALGMAFWLNPLLNGIAVWLTGRLAEKLTGDRRVAALAMLLTTVSVFHLFLSARLFPHQAILVCTLLAVLTAAGPLTIGRAAAIGLCVALIIPMRPQDGLFTAAAVAAFIAVRHRRPRVSAVAAFALPLVAGCGLYLLYQYALTGDWFTFPQDIYFAVTEQNDACHHIGLGTGCRRLNGFFLPAEGLTPRYGFFVTMTRLSMLLYKTTLHPLMWLFVLPAVWYGPRRHAAALLLLAAFVGGYFFFYQDGNFYGPRYYYSAGPLLLVAAADGFVALRDRLGGVARTALLALPLAGTLFTVGFIAPEFMPHQSGEWYRAAERIRGLVAAHDIRESVVFIPFHPGVTVHSANTLCLQDRPPHDADGNRYLNSLPLLDAQTAAYFLANGYRSAWLVTEDGEGGFAIAPLAPAPEGPIVIEAEYKFKPLSGRARYGFMVSNFGDDGDFSFRGAATPLSGYFGYGIRFGPADGKNYWDAEQHFVSAGRYRLTVEAVATPCGGETAVAVNGRDLGSFPAAADPQRAVHFTAEECLPAGANRFVLTPLDDEQCLVVDRIVAEWIGDCR